MGLLGKDRGGTDGPKVTEFQVLESLRSVKDPDLHKDIVTLGFVKDLSICDGAVKFTIELTTPACPMKERIEGDARRAVSAVPGVTQVNVKFTANTRSSNPFQDLASLPGIANIVAVASGKGGVGKSTVATNVAVALGLAGARVGLMDADIYGPSQALMTGVPKDQRPALQGNKMVPIERHGVKVMSIAFLLPDESAAVIWRGPMVGSAVKQFLTDVIWGELDYLVIDMPPGTGDAQLTLVQTVPVSGAVIVTTPQEVALIDVRRAIGMFRKVNVPVLGIVENMSYFVCPGCGSRHDIFLRDGGLNAAQEMEAPFLGQIPINPAIPRGGDSGIPIVVSHPDSVEAKVFREIAGSLAQRIAIHATESAAAQATKG
jgi:ATP-binding protein involved in chromosome partitioning